MWSKLIYNNVIYDNFLIDRDGNIKNKITDHIYKKYINKYGYVVNSLPMGKRGKVKTIRLHKALAETFILNPHNYSVVHHKDENKQNYSLDNLEWTDNVTNTRYHLQELSKTKELFNNRKLTKENINFIISHKDISNRKLAKIFNVSSTTISNVKNGKYYNNGVW